MKGSETVPETRQGGGFSAGLAPLIHEAQMKLKALKYMRYAGNPVQVGDVFEANSADVRILLALQRAEVYVEPAKERKIAAVFRPIPVMDRAVEPEVEEAEQVEDHKPRRYKRRDMKAE